MVLCGNFVANTHKNPTCQKYAKIHAKNLCKNECATHAKRKTNIGLGDVFRAVVQKKQTMFTHGDVGVGGTGCEEATGSLVAEVQTVVENTGRDECGSLLLSSRNFRVAGRHPKHPRQRVEPKFDLSIFEI